MDRRVTVRVDVAEKTIFADEGKSIQQIIRDAGFTQNTDASSCFINTKLIGKESMKKSLQAVYEDVPVEAYADADGPEFEIVLIQKSEGNK